MTKNGLGAIIKEQFRRLLMKKLVILFASAFMCLALFAQNAKSTGLTDADVKNFAKNYTKIEEELNKLDTAFSMETGLADEAAYVKAAEILLKFGISGNNTTEKLNMICYCFAVATYDRTLADLDEESKALLKALGQDPLAEYRALTNEKDYKVVEKNYDILAKAFEE